MDSAEIPLVRPYPPPSPSKVWSLRAQKVKEAFVYAYNGYNERAATHDELLPVSGGYIDNFNGWQVTVVDALDTMWIMGLRDDFAKAMTTMAHANFTLNPGHYAPFFETVIRYLGGLLSAYALSGEAVFLARAEDLGRMMLPAVDTTSGFPWYAVNTISGEKKPGSPIIAWAEGTSCQMEYKYLAHMTGRTEYFHAAEKVMDSTYSAAVPNGLFPSLWDINMGVPVNTYVGVGAFADSGYEYLIKQWVVSGRLENKAQDQYIKSITGILDNLVYLSPTRHLLYVTDTFNGMPSRKMEHLSCFLPGVLALGAATLPLSPTMRDHHMWAAQGIANTCWVMYADVASGLAADEVSMAAWTTDGRQQEGYATGRWKEHLLEWENKGRPGGVPPGVSPVETVSTPEKRDYYFLKDEYLLRPETVESFFYLWKYTGDEVWRQRSWAVFEAIQKNTLTPYGYASISHVDNPSPPKRDSMPSYFLAETLKYLYLQFIDEDLLPLDKWVFNTEAHPIPIYNWTNWERSQYGL